MLTIFNRRELTVTNDVQRQAAIRDALAAGNVHYKLTTGSHARANALFGAAGSRARMGSFGENLNYSCTYTFYVHKNDYERAKYLLRQI